MAELISLMKEYRNDNGRRNPLRTGLPGTNRPLRTAKLAVDSAVEEEYRKFADDFWPATRNALAIIAATRILEREEKRWKYAEGGRL